MSNRSKSTLQAATNRRMIFYRIKVGFNNFRHSFLQNYWYATITIAYIAIIIDMLIDAHLSGKFPLIIDLTQISILLVGATVYIFGTLAFFFSTVCPKVHGTSIRRWHESP